MCIHAASASGTTTGHHATNHFFRERKVEKTWTNCVFIGPICAKREERVPDRALGPSLPAIPKRGSNHSFLSTTRIVTNSRLFTYYSIWRIHPDKSAKICRFYGYKMLH